MENEVSWGTIPLKRNRKKESSTEPTMTMAALTKKGAGRKFTFNKAAQAAMGLKGEEFILLGFSGKQIFVRVVVEGTEGSYRLTKTCAFSDKRVYNSIIGLLGLSDQVENVFAVISVEGKDFSELVLQTGENTVSATPESAVENSVNSETTSVETVDAPTENTDNEDTSEMTASGTSSESTETGSEW